MSSRRLRQRRCGREYPRKRAPANAMGRENLKEAGCLKQSKEGVSSK